MPNAKVLEAKKATVAALAEQLKGAQSGVLVDYSGITVAEDTELRAELRNGEVQYSVIKNNMLRRALGEVGLSELESVLEGTTSLATGAEDPIAPIRIIADYAKKLGKEKFHIKAAFMEGRVLGDAEIAELSALSSKKDLQAQAMGTLLAPIVSLAAVLAAIVESKGGAPAEEAAPAAE